jgi:hypothetical protein
MSDIYGGALLGPALGLAQPQTDHLQNLIRYQNEVAGFGCFALAALTDQQIALYNAQALMRGYQPPAAHRRPNWWPQVSRGYLNAMLDVEIGTYDPP